MCKTANNVKKVLKLTMRSLWEDPTNYAVQRQLSAFTVMVKFDQIKTTTGAGEAATQMTAQEVICKPAISFDGVMKTRHKLSTVEILVNLG